MYTSYMNSNYYILKLSNYLNKITNKICSETTYARYVHVYIYIKNSLEINERISNTILPEGHKLFSFDVIHSLLYQLTLF